MVQSLTIEQKIGQLLICRHPRNEKERDEILTLIRNRSLGGIHLRKGASHLTPQEVKRAADYPILIAENMENGLDDDGYPPLGDQLSVGASNNPDLAYEQAALTARQAKAAGYNMVFGPVLDIASDPRSPIVGTRSFGSEPARVAEFTTAAVRGYQDNGVVVTAKHFPGFDAAHGDSHIASVRAKVPLAKLRTRDFHPYIRAIREADLSGIMVGHIVIPEIDLRRPASLSPTLIRIIRELGFNGVIITDSLAMFGLSEICDQYKVHSMALQAGVDLVLASYRISPLEAYCQMLETVESGLVSKERIEHSYERVRCYQERTAIEVKSIHNPNKCYDPEHDFHKRLVEQSVTDSAGGNGPSTSPSLIVAQRPNVYCSGGTCSAEFNDLPDLEAQIRRAYPDAKVLFVSDYPDHGEIERILTEAIIHESIVMILAARIHQYLGSGLLSERLVALVDGLKLRLHAIVLRGNPAAGAQLPDEIRLIYCYGATTGSTSARANLEIALRVLKGEHIAEGRLPLHIARCDVSRNTQE